VQNNTDNKEKRNAQLALKLISKIAAAKEYSYGMHEKVTEDVLAWKASG